MKKLLFILVAIAIAAPAMAVTLTGAQVGTTATGNIGYSGNGQAAKPDPTRVSGFALKISVDSGAIITGCTRAAENANGAKYGIFPGTIVINGTTGVVTDYNTPVEPDNLRGIGGASKLNTNQIIIAMGALWAGDANKPGASGQLVTITVDKTCTVTVTPETTARAGVVGEDAATMTVTPITFPITVGTVVCLQNKSAAIMADWATLGSPACWCAPYQCDGDAALATETLSKYRVYINDLNLLQGMWQKKITDAAFIANPCADFDHKSETLSKYRVYINDLNKLQSNWQKKDSNLAGDCATRVMN